MKDLPLDGQRVVVTRAVHQAGELRTVFEQAGADVVSLPLIEVTAAADPALLEQAAAAVASFDWLAFTSANAVRAFVPLTTIVALPAVAAIGPATAEALRAYGVEVALEAEISHGTGLVEAMAPELGAGTRILVPQADDARPELVVELRAAGAEVTAVVAYGKRLPAAAAELAGRLFGASTLGWVTFTSPRIVRHFVAVLGSSWGWRRNELKAVSIGPVTSAELRRQGVEPAAEALRPGADAMVRAVQEKVESSTGE